MIFGHGEIGRTGINDKGNASQLRKPEFKQESGNGNIQTKTNVRSIKKPPWIVSLENTE